MTNFNHSVGNGRYSKTNRDIPWKVRSAIFKRDGWSCLVCGTTFSEKEIQDNRHKQKQSLLSVDHIVPKKFGSTNAKYNLVSLCVDCNCCKGDKQPFVWLSEVKPSMLEKKYLALYARVFLAVKMHILEAQ